MPDRKWKRRQFLRHAVTAGMGTMGLQHVVPPSALGKDRAVPPSERIGLGFIGPGGQGIQLLGNFAPRPQVEMLAVCDVRANRRQKALGVVERLATKRKSGGAYRARKPYRDFREVLARPDIDAVVLAACEHWRPIMCIMAAKAGKDVYSEKPFALTAGEAAAMVQAIRRYGRIFQHGTQCRCSSKIRTACEMVRSGRIGKVTHAVVPVGPGPGPGLPEYARTPAPPNSEVFDWDLWLGPAPWWPYGSLTGWDQEYCSPIWQRYRDFGLGSIGNWGSHTLDMAQWALGKDAESPVEVVPPGDDNDTLALKYADGLTILCPRTPGDAMDATVFGTEGQKVLHGKPEIEDKYDPTPLGPHDVKLGQADDYYANWLDCIHTRNKTICNEGVAYRGGLLCVLIAMADRLKRPLNYDPHKGEFPGDAEANRLLDTAKRAPWQAY